VRLGLDVAQHQLTFDEIVARAKLAEDAGLDGVWVFDQSKNRLCKQFEGL
jgi:alkanesulfonate monooxygenase SsuD/methylene tetrahydromethanopterin reductase-like flavin-dependent oxidoreductase (luciferase family)